MTQILPLAEIRRGLAQASGLPAMLSASLDAFEAMLTLLREQEDPPGPGFAAFALAAASAANGRDAIAFAPSPPPAGPGQVGPAPKVPHTSLPAATVAADLGELALALADYLEDAAASAVDPDDRDACQDGARHAAAVSALLTGRPGRDGAGDLRRLRPGRPGASG